MKKILFISGTRADYGLMRNTLLELNKHFKLLVIATGMHLSPNFGLTIKEIENDGLKTRKVHMVLDGDDLSSMVQSLGVGFQGISLVAEDFQPNMILLEGDRGESLVGAIVGSYLNILVLHHGGGDLSGSIDNKNRNAISMLSDYHFAGNKESYNRLISMGISSEKVFLVGEPGLDDIFSENFTSEREIYDKYHLNLNEPFSMLIQHSNTEEDHDSEQQIVNTLEAIKEIQIRTIAIYANSDAGGKAINQKIKEYSDQLDFLTVYSHIERRDFLGLLNLCSLMVGNSSSGLIELPSFHKPFVNVGTRQKDRLKTENTIEVGYDKNEIIKGIEKALNDKKFNQRIKYLKNPYGDGRTSHRIVKIISDILGYNENY